MEVSGESHASAALSPRESAISTTCVGGWVDVAGLDILEVG